MAMDHEERQRIRREEQARKHRAWQQRSAKRYHEKRLKAPRAVAMAKSGRKPGRNDSDWREDGLALYGRICAVPGCGETAVEMDHIKPRAQGGKSDIYNALPLCGAFSRTIDGGHHGAKTAGLLKIDPQWLTEDQKAYLALIGWVDWDDKGLPFGEGWKHFTATKGPDHE